MKNLLVVLILMLQGLLVGLFLLSSAVARADTFGVATAPLARGGTSVYGQVGFPETVVGFRQGYSIGELGAEAGLDASAVSFFGVATVRRTLLERYGMNLALDFKFGAFGNTGARWNEPGNRSGSGLRLEPGASISYKTRWPMSVLGFIRAPADIPLSQGSVTRVAGLLGGGVEIALVADYFLMVNGSFGPMVRTHVPQATTTVIEGAVGLGYRMF